MPLSMQRREFSIRLASLLAAASSVSLPAVGSASTARRRAWIAPTGPELSRTAEAIHEEIPIKASRQEVYDALTDAGRFSKLTTFSMLPKAAPATIGRGAGGAFTLFDGHITGRNIELVPATRVVQAWRSAAWPAGSYSIARFELTGAGSATTIVFDHTGFPAGQGEHLVEGWETNYWTPLRKLFG